MNCIPDAPEILRRLPWITANCLHIVLSFATILLSIKFVSKLRKSGLLNASTVMLMLLFTAFANVHAVVLIVIQVYGIINSAIHTDACSLSMKTSNCAIFNFTLLSCVVGMTICQNALWIDRLAATIRHKLHHQHAKCFGGSLCALVISLAVLVPLFILYDDPYDDVVLTCLFIPAGSSVEVNRLFNAFLILNLVAVTANIILYLVNRRRQKTLRFNVTKRYRSFENILISKWVGMVVSVQFIFLMTYSLAMFLIRTKSQNMHEVTKQVLRIWFYVVPFSTVALPLISILAFRIFRKHRAAAITRMTSMKADDNTYMKHLMKMWS
ncbi:unnamed protein product [Cylicocyclus nassatus]|uniref:Uncharacterized protein n=1 Tax=Cylicocyclus nassatus TaxID=53992 RepID=A0AA36DT63_CYLNA|nr:unnamed protein product [Cylicocyclus nassatus]